MSIKLLESSMSDNGRAKANGGSFLGLLRAVSLLALVAGAAGSLVFMFRAGQQTPPLLLLTFMIWILAPFVVLLWAARLSKRWSIPTQVAFYCVMLLVALGSLAIYGEWVNIRPAGSANAFLFVAVPPVSLLVITIVVSIAALLGRMSRRDESH
jgi:hypothetical protein